MAVGNLSVVGLGLIGGSVALGARERGLARRVTAFDLSPAAAEEALAAGAVDRVAPSLAECCREADLVIVAVPVMAIAPLALQAHAVTPPAAVISDVGSTKTSIVTLLDALPEGGPSFVGGHPIAGRENSGFASARGDLFQDAPFVITPGARSGQGVEVVHRFWSGLGCRVHVMPPRQHDRLFAYLSHLPHLAAYALTDAVLEGVGGPDTARTFTGGGFRDFTRIAASDPVMWRDISLDNRDLLLPALDHLIARLDFLRGLLAAGDGAELEVVLTRIRAAKRSL
jgi:prephenate dehydrogenase